MKRKKVQKENHTSESLDLDSLLKLASNLSNQYSFVDQLSKNNDSDDADEVDLSSVLKDISEAASHTFAGIGDDLRDIKDELKKLNKNIETMVKNK